MKCAVCSLKEGKNICKKCGKEVCDVHYDSNLGVCVNCGPKSIK